MKNLLIIATLFNAITSAHASTCSEMIQTELSKRVHENKISRNDLVMSLFFSTPIVIVFPPALVFPGVAIGYKIAASLKVKKAKTALQIYEEAAQLGGKKTIQLYKKMKKTFPSSEMSYQDFLTKINEANLKGEGCQKGDVPNPKEIMTEVLAD